MRFSFAGFLILTISLGLGLFIKPAASTSTEEPLIVNLLQENSLDLEIPSGEEPSTFEVLEVLGFTNVTQSAIQTFPAGLYEIIVYAEFADYHESNTLMYYPLANSSNVVTLFAGLEGSFGFVTPPTSKTFSCPSTFGLSLYVEQENRSYYSENWRNPDGQIHSEVYLNLDTPSHFVIAFEDLYDLGDRDFNDLVLSIRSIQHYLSVDTDPSGIQVIPGAGWYNHFTNVTLDSPDSVLISSGTRFTFLFWNIDGFPKPSGVNPVTVTMNANHTAIAHLGRQHYLTVKTEPKDIAFISGEGWLDEDSERQLEAPFVEDYSFVEWTVDGVSQGAGVLSVTVKMDAPHTAKANYEPVSIGGSTAAAGSQKLTVWACLSSTIIQVAVLTAYSAKRLKRTPPS